MTISIDRTGGADAMQAVFENARSRFATINRAAAQYLDMDEQELRSQLDAGQTLQDIATAKGKSVDGLKQALVEALDGVSTSGRTDSAAFVDRILRARRGQPPEEGVLHGGNGPRLDFAKVDETVSDYLGLDALSVHELIASGKSLGDIAISQGKSVDGLKSALVDALGGSTSSSSFLATVVSDLVENTAAGGRGGRLSTIA